MDPDMSKPVTRGELRIELADLRTEMHAMGNMLNDRIDAAAKLVTTHLTAAMEAMERRLSIDLARHIAAFSEDLRGRVYVVDDNYKDLPARLTKH